MGKILVVLFALLSVLLGVVPRPQPDQETAHLSTPNRLKGLERFLGLGVVFPYPYFQKPKYRYPVYDRDGRGYPFYGFGDKQVFGYSKFDRTEGHH